MKHATKTFWKFLFENLSIIKTGGLLLALVYSLVSFIYIANSIIFLLQANYTEGFVKENIQRTYTCYTRYSNTNSCTDFNTVMVYFDESGNEKIFQTQILEAQEIGKPFTILYSQEGKITLLEQVLVLWFQIFIFSTMIPIYLMIYHAYMKDITPYKKQEQPIYKEIFKYGMLSWLGFVGISIWLGGSIFLYLGGDRIMSYGLFLVCIAVIHNIHGQLKN